MTHDDWVVFIRCCNGVGLFSSAVMMGAGAGAWAVVLFFVTTVFALCCMVADGFIGSWRETRDYYEQRKAAEEAQRMARQFRRTMDLYEWERRRSNG